MRREAAAALMPAAAATLGPPPDRRHDAASHLFTASHDSAFLQKPIPAGYFPHEKAASGLDLAIHLAVLYDKTGTTKLPHTGLELVVHLEDAVN